MTRRPSLASSSAGALAAVTAILLGAGVGLPISGVANAAELAVDVINVRDATGKMMVALHAPADGVKFPDLAGAVAAQWRKAEPGTMRFVFSGLKPGQYAVAVYHDANDNGALDTNPLGMPIEGYGFSKDAKGYAGPPDFGAAAIELTATGATAPVSTSVALTY